MNNSTSLNTPSYHDSVKADRIARAKQTIEDTPALKKMIDDNPDFVTLVKTYDFIKLIEELQPKWTNQKFLSEKETVELTLLIMEYQLRGCDMEYFTSGSGSYIKPHSNFPDCVIL